MFKWLFGIAIFNSAFLLFFIQPLLAKHILPIFGGSAFVWIVSILFFQIGLLLGYGYAYLLAKFLSERKQALIHFFLLICSFYYIPLHLHQSISVDNLWPPVAVLKLLGINILLPFIIISASSPLLQHWYCRIKHTQFPYYYYSISNLGSLLGLLGYPFLIEPLMGINSQALMWSGLYSCYTVLCILCIIKLVFTKPIIEPQIIDPQISLFQILSWLLLTFLSSAFLLSITQYLTQNVINLPLMWVLPLALYLISFIVTFKNPKGYDRTFWIPTFILWLILTLLLFYHYALYGKAAVIILLSLFYAFCMVCHGQLIRLKPASQNLTLFYLFIALGGVLGGIFTNIVALFLFKNWWDFYLPLIMLSIIVTVLSVREYRLSFKKWDLGITLFSFVSILTLFSIIILEIFYPHESLVAQKRNLYGFMRVYDFKFPNQEQNFRQLMHGTVIHGMQYLNQKRKLWPTAYFGPHSGPGVAIEFFKQLKHKSINIGVVGLGCGTIAALTEKGDYINFYEIDEDIKSIAYQYFSYLTESPSKTHVTIGDARLQMKQESQQKVFDQYDVLIIDAFNGDAIPFHLLTIEAMQIYNKLLKKNGVLVFQTTNIYVNLLPLTKGLADNLGCNHYLVETKEDNNKGLFASRWVLISCNPALGPWLSAHKDISLILIKNIKPILWTDDYNSILPIIKWQ